MAAKSYVQILANPSEINEPLVKQTINRKFTRSSKKIIFEVFNNLKIEFPNLTIRQRIKLTSKLTKISEWSIYMIRKEFKDTGKFSTPKKKRVQMTRPKKHANYLYLDAFQLGYVRQVVHHFFRRNEVPTLLKIHSEVLNGDIIPCISRATLHRVLVQLGFKYSRQKRNAYLIERDDIVAWRRHYLSSIADRRADNKKVYYLDETWVNEGDTPEKVWSDFTIKSPKDAFLKGLTTGLKPVNGKGRRLILAHIGSEDGFVPDGLLQFKAVRGDGDYHHEMNHDVFNRWMETIFPKLLPNSVIVMDNAPYHSIQLNKSPTNAWKKADIEKWLIERNIPIPRKALKAELMELARRNKVAFKIYMIDERAKELGFEVIRLPPYHCSLNPIEMAWAQVKNDVRMNNTTHKLADLEGLLKQAIGKVTPSNWLNYVNHVINEEKELWRVDDLLETTVDPLIINVGNGSEDSDSENEIPEKESNESILVFCCDDFAMEVEI